MGDEHAGDAPMANEPHGLGDHGETHGHDDHGHGDDALGPVDWPAWRAGIVGAVAGLLVVWAFVIVWLSRVVA